MKKISLVLAAVVCLFSCSLDDDQCNCGLIIDDGINGDNYWIDIRNDCSGRTARFNLAPGDWINAFVGTDYCITNVTSW